MKRLSFFLFLFFLWMTVRAQMLRSSGLVLYGGKNTETTRWLHRGKDCRLSIWQTPV